MGHELLFFLQGRIGWRRMTASEHNERKANTSANALKALPLLAANTTNASCGRTTPETFTHTGEALSICEVPRAHWCAFVVFVVFGRRRSAGLRAFAPAFAHALACSLARARLFYS